MTSPTKPIPITFACRIPNATAESTIPAVTPHFTLQRLASMPRNATSSTTGATATTMKTMAMSCARFPSGLSGTISTSQVSRSGETRDKTHATSSQDPYENVIVTASRAPVIAQSWPAGTFPISRPRSTPARWHARSSHITRAP